MVKNDGAGAERSARVAKIRKLMELAANAGASAGEADNAARMAGKLMAKYGIDLAELDEETLRDELDLCTMAAAGCRPGKKNAKSVPSWIGLIAWGVKVFTRTRLRSYAGSATNIYFSGPREDVELAVWLHDLLVENAYKASRAAASGGGASEAAAFRNGYASVMQRRLKAMAAARHAGATEAAEGFGGSTALVISDSRREAIMEAAFGPEGAGRARRVASSEAGRRAGAAAAIPTGRPISGGEGRKALC